MAGFNLDLLVVYILTCSFIARTSTEVQEHYLETFKKIKIVLINHSNLKFSDLIKPELLRQSSTFKVLIFRRRSQAFNSREFFHFIYFSIGESLSHLLYLL